MHNLYTLLNMLLNINQKIQNDKSAREDQNGSYSSVKSIKFTLMDKYILYTLFIEICYWLAHIFVEKKIVTTLQVFEAQWSFLVLWLQRKNSNYCLSEVKGQGTYYTLLGMMLKDDKSWYMYLNLQVTYKRRINSY